MKSITEKMNVHKKWYKKARKMSMDKLPEFINHLMNDYRHDYGTICHALTSGAIATMWAMDKKAGITGFQASCIMWEFIQNWMSEYKDKPLQLLNYENLLYPQYEDKFSKTISQSTWDWLRKEARKKIRQADKDYKQYLIDCEVYKKELKKFIKKYPDYETNQEKYDRILSGTSDEWEKQDKKKEEGFEFSPDKPCHWQTKGNAVYTHWEDILNGKLPFGFTVKED